MEEDFNVICSKIDEEKEFLNTVSQEIWRKPELRFQEVQAHAFLSSTLEKCGFKVKKHYLLDTAFKAEYIRSENHKQDSGPTIAILLEYDALPEIGHACGHNLISEVGLGAAIAVKEVMERNPTLPGKLIVLGTPAEEGGGGKIRMIEKGAFDGIDVALMAHPTPSSCALPTMICIIRGNIEYTGKEAHAAGDPWEGVNALDAAVLFYNNISVLRQQTRTENRIHVILTEGGLQTNIIPAKSRLEIAIRAPSDGQLQELRSRIELCIKAAADATGCEVQYAFDESDYYKNLVSNKALADVYRKYCEKLGMTFKDTGLQQQETGSTDMGNVSYIVPAIHPFFGIPTEGVNHTKEFTDASGLPTAQPSTLIAAKGLAMTAVSVLRSPDLMREVQDQFKLDTSKNN